MFQLATVLPACLWIALFAISYELFEPPRNARMQSKQKTMLTILYVAICVSVAAMVLFRRHPYTVRIFASFAAIMTLMALFCHLRRDNCI